MTKTVLTVDDSASMRSTVRDLLEDLGHEVLEADDGLAGLEVLAEHRVDLVITDLNMPNLDGLGFIRRVRADDRYAGLPILMLTTEGHADKMREGKAAGASGWIVKPFNELQLEMTINKFIG
jgi:two-component system chemotaxis response regulator CheY